MTKIKSLIINLGTIVLLFCSCTIATNQSEDNKVEQFNLEEGTDIETEYSNLTSQDLALDALDEIQRSGTNLYSTFQTTPHDCTGPISNFQISKEEFEAALITLLSLHYPNLSINKQEELASTAAKAQENYLLTTCGSTTVSLEMEQGIAPPRKGTWIFHSLLEQRDLIINW